MDSGVTAEIVRWLTKIAGAGIAILPLFLLIGLVKTISQVDNLIGKLQGGVSKGAGGLGEKWGKKLDSGRELDAVGKRGLYGGPLGAYRRYKNKEDNKIAGRESEIKRARASYHADLIQSDAGYRNAVAGGTFGSAAEGPALNRALANAINVKAQIEADEVKAASAIIKNADVNLDDLKALSGGGTAKGLDGSDMAVRRAAMQQLIKSNDVEGINKLVDDSLKWSHANDTSATPAEREQGSKLRATLAESLGDSSGRPAWLTKGVLATVENGENKLDTTGMIKSAIDQGVYSPQNISTADKIELKTVENVITSIDSAAEPALAKRAADVVANATATLGNERLEVTLAKNRAAVTSLSGAKTK